MFVCSHLNLSKEFNAYSFEINNIKLGIDDETKTRAIINRLYYALFHRILPEIKELKNNEGANQHDAICRILLKKAPNQDATKLFLKLKSLRVWADYEINNPPYPIDLKRLISQTNSFVKSSWNLK